MDGTTNHGVTDYIHSYSLARTCLFIRTIDKSERGGGLGGLCRGMHYEPCEPTAGTALKNELDPVGSAFDLSWIRQLYSHPRPIRGSQARGRLGAICREEGVTTSPLGDDVKKTLREIVNSAEKELAHT